MDDLDELTQLEHRISGLSESELDEQQFGIIRLDARGVVQAYNTYEEHLVSRNRNTVIGKHFFLDVAPCTRVRAFYGRFLLGVARGELRARFGFIFTLPSGDRRVEVTMLKRAPAAATWVVVAG